MKFLFNKRYRLLLPIFLFVGIITGFFLIRSPAPTGPSTDFMEPIVVYSGQTTPVTFKLRKQDIGLGAVLMPRPLPAQEGPPSILPSNSPPFSNDGVSFGGARRMAIRGETAYVADWFSGLHLYDIRNPSEPVLISSFHTPGSPKDVVLSGNTAIVADDDYGINLIDITDPNHPRSVSRLQTPGLAYGLALEGHLLYLASHRGGFQVIDIGDIKNPRIISHVETPGLPWGIDVKNQTVFIAADTSGILIYDAGDPANPQLIGAFNPGGQAEDVVIRGEHAFAVFFDRGLYILNIKNPARPEVIAHLLMPGNSRGLEIIEGYALIADWKEGIQVIDIGNLSQAKIVGSYDTDGAAWGVRVKGREAFVSDWWGGFTVLDISRPESPVLSGRYHGRGTLKDISVKGTYAFLANGRGGLQVYDIRNPFNPMWVTGLDHLGDTQSITVEDHLAYIGSTLVGSDSPRLSIVDISNPFQLRLISETLTSLPINRLGILNDKAYLSDLHTGLVVMDVSDPSSPVELASYKGHFNDFIFEGEFLFLATDEGLELHNVSDPRSLLPVGQFFTENPVRLLQVRIPEVYLYEEEVGIRVVSMEGNLSETLSIFNPGEALRDMKISGDTLYAMTETSTLMELDISDPRAIRLTGLTPSTIQAKRLDLSEDAVFFTGGRILRAIKPPPRAELTHQGGGNFSITLPEDMQPGLYDLVLTGPRGPKKVYSKAVRVARPDPEEEFSVEDYQKLLKEKCPTCPQ